MRGMNLLAKAPQVAGAGVANRERRGQGCSLAARINLSFSSSSGCYQRLVPQERLGTS